MSDTTKHTDITDARTPEQTLKIARARANEQMKEYARKADAAASEGNRQLAELWQESRDGMACTEVFLGDLLHELNKRNQQG